jgi:hypothetical protein
MNPSQTKADRVGLDTSEEVAAPVEAINQPNTPTVIEQVERDEVGLSAERNRTGDHQNSATQALEGSDTGTPPRKSTRGGANHIKPDNQQQRQEVREVHSPQARADRGK